MSRDNFWLRFNVRLDVILQRFVQFTNEIRQKPKPFHTNFTFCVSTLTAYTQAIVLD